MDGWNQRRDGGGSGACGRGRQYPAGPKDKRCSGRVLRTVRSWAVEGGGGCGDAAASLLLPLGRVQISVEIARQVQGGIESGDGNSLRKLPESSELFLRVFLYQVYDLRLYSKILSKVEDFIP